MEEQEEIFIVLKDTIGEFFHKRLIRPMEHLVIRGQLAVRIPDKNSRSGQPHNYQTVYTNRPSTFSGIGNSNVAPLFGAQVPLLLGVESPEERYELFMQGRLDWGTSLKVNDAVCVSLHKHTAYNAVTLTTTAVIHYIGPIREEKGNKFGVEITDPNYYGQGTTDGSVNEECYFHCNDGNGMFVSLDKLSEVPPGYQVPPWPSPPQSRQPHKRKKKYQFKEGDRVVAFKGDGTLVGGTVRWVGRYALQNEKKQEFSVSAVGIETDIKVVGSDFESCLPTKHQYFTVGKNRGNLFMREEEVIPEADFLGQAQQEVEPPQNLSPTPPAQASQKSLPAQESPLSEDQEMFAEQMGADTHTDPNFSGHHPNESPPPLVVGSRVELIQDHNRHGVIRWMGTLPGIQGHIAGVELDAPMFGCGDGEWKDQRYFTCSPGTAYFCPVTSLSLDSHLDPNLSGNPVQRYMATKGVPLEIAVKDAGLLITDLVETGRTLGTGLYGEVVEVIVRGKQYAKKKLHGVLTAHDVPAREKSALTERFETECQRVLYIEHTNIIDMIGIHFDPVTSYPTLVMELMDINLCKYLENNPKSSVPLSTKYSILLDVASGLLYLHTLPSPLGPMLHRDLNASNILLALGSRVVAKIADLGQAIDLAHATRKQSLSQVPGKSDYMPPEAWLDNPVYDTSLDIFSFGVVILHTLTHQWPRVLPKLESEMVVQTEVERRQPLLDKISTSPLKSLIVQCLGQEPGDRPSSINVFHALKKCYDNSVEEQKLLEEAMKEGRVDAGEGLLMLLGVTGSGKSEFKRIVLRKKVPKDSPSTPLATRPVSVCNTKVDGVEWKEMGPKEMLEMVAVKMNQRKQRSVDATGDAPTSSEPGNVPTKRETPDLAPKDDIREVREGEGEGGELTSPKENLEGDQSERITEQESLVGLGQEFYDALKQIDLELIQAMRESSKDDTEPSRLMRVDLIYLLDSGGQPPFREMLPHFVQHASAIVLMQKLNERLDYKPTIRYREKGRKVDKGYTSQLTNEQILHQYVQAVQSHNSKVFVIGTHRDKEDDCKGETREKKNKRLRRAFGEVLKGQLIFYESGELIFPLNCRSRKKADKLVARKFKERVMKELRKLIPAPIPLPWFILKQLLQLLAQNLGKSVLSIEECCEAAKQKLHMSEDSCRAALKHLGQLNIIFYRPDILPGIVFSNVQVILDKITELVHCNHELRPKETRDPIELQKDDEGPDDEDTSSEDSSESSESEMNHAVSDPVPNAMKTDRGEEFRDFGRVDSELLKDAFPSHYREGLFTVPDLLLVLERMLIAGRLDSGKHFIPSLLPDLSVEEIAEYRATADHPSPLVIYYHNLQQESIEYPELWLPVGVMSSLVVYLQNHCRLGLSKEEPSYHNCFLFDLPGGEPGDMVLIDSIRFLEVHIRSTCPLTNKYFHTIKENILTGLQEAHASLHYRDPEVKLGFLCSGKCGDTEAHLATLNDEKTRWKCSNHPKIWEEISQEQMQWLKDPVEGSGECPEIITRLRENLPLVIRTVTVGGNLHHFAHHLVAKGFIPQHTAQQILDTPGLATDAQACKLMDGVFLKIEHSEKRKEWFGKFVDIFNLDSTNEYLVHKLLGKVEH